MEAMRRGRSALATSPLVAAAKLRASTPCVLTVGALVRDHDLHRHIGAWADLRSAQRRAGKMYAMFPWYEAWGRGGSTACSKGAFGGTCSSGPSCHAQGHGEPSPAPTPATLLLRGPALVLFSMHLTSRHVPQDACGRLLTSEELGDTLATLKKGHILESWGAAECGSGSRRGGQQQRGRERVAVYVGAGRRRLRAAGVAMHASQAQLMNALRIPRTLRAPAAAAAPLPLAGLLRRRGGTPLSDLLPEATCARGQPDIKDIVTSSLHNGGRRQEKERTAGGCVLLFPSAVCGSCVQQGALIDE